MEHFYETLFPTKAKCRESQFHQQAHMFLLWQLIFFESTEAVIIEAIIVIIVTMMTFDPRFLQLRDKPSSLLFMKEDTIKVILVLLCRIKFLC